MALPRLRTRMAEVEWKAEVATFGDGFNSSPWAKVEHAGFRRYYWRAKRPDSDTVDGWTDTLEDAQRRAEDWLFPDRS